MGLLCACGALLPDGLDALPGKGRFIADQDYADFLESRDPRLVREAFLCEACGRLSVEDGHGGRRRFLPEGDAGRGLLSSVRGDAYPAMLVGEWRAWKSPPDGELFWEPSGSRPGGFERFTDRSALEKRFHAVLETLRREGRLRGAWLHEGETTLHRWP